MKKKSLQKDSSALNKVLIISVCVVLVIYTVSILMPLVWGLLTSLKSRMDFQFENNKLGLPNLDFSWDEVFKLKNYVQILTNFEMRVSTSYIGGGRIVSRSATYGFPMLLLFTLLYAGGGAIIQTVVPCVVAYLCVKYPYRLSKVVVAIALFIMVMPIVGNYPSEITLLRKLNLYDSIIGNYIQKFNFTGMYFFVFLAFFQGLPDAYMEAAEIDGASQMRVLVHIIFPLAAKIISTVMLINFIAFWNDYQTPLLYLPTKPTIAYGIFQLTRDSGQSNGFNFVPIKIAGCMLLALPIFVIFIALRKKLMGNISMGGIKE